MKQCDKSISLTSLFQIFIIGLMSCSNAFAQSEVMTAAAQSQVSPESISEVLKYLSTEPDELFLRTYTASVETDASQALLPHLRLVDMPDWSKLKDANSLVREASRAARELELLRKRAEEIYTTVRGDEILPGIDARLLASLELLSRARAASPNDEQSLWATLRNSLEFQIVLHSREEILGKLQKHEIFGDVDLLLRNPDQVPSTPLENIVAWHHRRLDEKFGVKFCGENTIVCTRLRRDAPTPQSLVNRLEPSAPRTHELLQSLKNDLAIVRQLLHQAAIRLTMTGQPTLVKCESTREWITFPLTDECLKSIENGWSGNAGKVSSADLWVTWLHVPAFEMRLDQIASLMKCAPSDCLQNPILTSIAQQSGVAIDDLLGTDFAGRSTVRALASALEPALTRMRALSHDGIDIYANSREAVRAFACRHSYVTDAVSDARLTLALYHVRLGKPPSPPVCSFHPDVPVEGRIGITVSVPAAELSSVEIADASAFRTWLHSQSTTAQWKVNVDELAAWISTLPSAEHVSNAVSSSRFANGELTIDQMLALSMPWQLARAGACQLMWEHIDDASPLTDCILSALKESTVARIQPAIEQWLNRSSVEPSIRRFLEKLRSDFTPPTDLGSFVFQRDLIEMQIAAGLPIRLQVRSTSSSIEIDETKLAEKLVARTFRSVGPVVVSHDAQRDRWSVKWVTPGELVSIGYLVEEERTTTFVVSGRPSVVIPGLGSGRIETARVDSENGYSFGFREVTDSNGLAIGRVEVSVENDGHIGVSFDDPEVITSKIRALLDAQGLSMYGVISVRWDYQQRAITASLRDSAGELHTLSMTDGWEAAAQEMLRSSVNQNATAVLDRLFSSAQVGSHTARLGSLLLERTCSEDGVIECTVSVAEASASNCKLWSVQLASNADPVFTREECSDAWLSRRWNSAAAIQVTSGTLLFSPWRLQLKFTIATTNRSFTSAAVVDLATGAVQLDETAKVRIETFLRDGVESLLTATGNELARIARELCDELAQSLSAGGSASVQLTVDGRSSCGEVAWQDEPERERTLEASVTVAGFSAPLVVTGVRIAPLQRKVLFGRAGFTEQSVNAVVREIIDGKLLNGALTVRSQAAGDGLSLNAVVPIRLFNLQTLDVPVSAYIDKHGLTVAANFRNSVLNSLVTNVNSAFLPVEVVLGGWNVEIVSAEANDYPHVRLVMNVKLPDSRSFATTATLDLKTGGIGKPTMDAAINDVLIDQLKQAARSAVDQLPSGVGAFKIGKETFENCNQIETLATCRLRLPVLLDLSALGLDKLTSGDIPFQDVIVTLDKRVQFTRPGNTRVPLPGPLALSVVTLDGNSLGVDEDKITISSTVSVADAPAAIRISATLEINTKTKVIKILGPATLLSVLPVGSTASRISPDGFTTWLDVGGKLSKIFQFTGCTYSGKNMCALARADVGSLAPMPEGCSTSEKATLRGCGTAKFFQLANANVSMSVSANTELQADGHVNFKLANASGHLQAGPKFSRPTLRAALNVEPFGGITITRAAVAVSLGSASFDISALGLTVGLVVQNLHELKKEQLQEMILRLLLPDINLEKLLQALLSGNLKINPFSSFGPKGGESQGDGGSKGHTGSGGAGAVPAQSPGKGPIDYDGDGMQSLQAFSETAANVLSDVANGTYERPLPKNLPPGVSSANLSLVALGTAQVGIAREADGYLVQVTMSKNDEAKTVAKIPARTPEGISLVRDDKHFEPAILFGVHPTGFLALANKDQDSWLVGLIPDMTVVPLLELSRLKFPSDRVNRKVLTASNVDRRLLEQLGRNWQSCWANKPATGQCDYVALEADYDKGFVRYTTDADKEHKFSALVNAAGAFKRLDVTYVNASAQDVCSTPEELEWLASVDDLSDVQLFKVNGTEIVFKKRHANDAMAYARCAGEKKPFMTGPIDVHKLTKHFEETAGPSNLISTVRERVARNRSGSARPATYIGVSGGDFAFAYEDEIVFRFAACSNVPRSVGIDDVADRLRTAFTGPERSQAREACAGADAQACAIETLKNTLTDGPTSAAIRVGTRNDPLTYFCPPN